MHFWINLYKPKNFFSTKAVNKIKKKFGLKKIGHAGTLDPIAEGILPLAIGKTTSLISILNNKYKSYEFELEWGKQTSTDDYTGEVIAESKKIPDILEIKSILSKFIGTYYQLPPKASAKKINGSRAYDLFRKKISFELSKSEVNVSKLAYLSNSNKKTSKFFVECKSGFYVRSLARDLGIALNTKAHILTIKRTKVGLFNENNSILLDDLTKISHLSQKIKGYYNSSYVLDDIPALEIEDKNMEKSIYQGKKINLSFFKTFDHIDIHNSNLCYVFKNDNLISLGLIEGDFFKPKKVFTKEV